MKSTHYILIAVVASVFMHCKSSKESGSKTVVTYTPTSQQLEFANKRWAGSTQEELKEGQNIYTGKCTECHKNFPVEKFSEKKWLHEIDDMSPKAHLTADEKTKLTKYLLSMRDTKVTPVTN